MLIQQNLSCDFCHKEFYGCVQFSAYRCNDCGKSYTICPECAKQQRHCACSGEIIKNDAYIRRHGINDINGNHYNMSSFLY